MISYYIEGKFVDGFNMADKVKINNELLSHMIQERPVLWDKS